VEGQVLRILIAAGGSGGHIFPGVALARKLKEKASDVDILFVGSGKNLDRNIFEKEGFRRRFLSTNKLPYGLSIHTVVFCLRLLFDAAKSFFIVASYRPSLTVGFGGYVSGPISMASALFGIPIIAHEQNVVPGRANRLLFRLATKIALSFRETEKLLGKDAAKAVFTGNPVRASVEPDKERDLRRCEGVKNMGLDTDKFTVLVIGGSQGARPLNEKFIDMLHKIDSVTRKTLQVIHITGIRDYAWAAKEYELIGVKHRVHTFIDRIEDAYSASDLVVTRAGASAMFETALFGIPMILVPYRFAMSHQLENAMAFSEKGAAITIEEEDLAAGAFKDKILNLISNRSALEALARSARSLSVPEASDNLANVILDLSDAKG